MSQAYRVAWNSIPLEERQQLEQRLTDKQFNAYALWLAGLSYRRTAELFGTSVRTQRDHIRRAQQVHLLIKDGPVRPQEPFSEAGSTS